MKHTLKITLILILLFLLSQLIGLVVVNGYLVEDLPYNIERPEWSEKESGINIITMIIFITIIAFIIMKFNLLKLWKTWFFIAVLVTLSISFSVFINSLLAFIAALIFAILKIFRNNVYIHNFTEVFIYGSIGAIFVPLLNIMAVSILLILISVYDYIAVYKIKHMVGLAKFQSKARLFAGLFIPYGKNSAILGGGDMAFPLLFTGVVMKSFGIKALIITMMVTLALSLLLFKSEKKKFYPAMPFLSIGCFIGLGLLYLI